MGCFGRDSEKLEHVKAEHQWSFINLSDFTASSFLTPLSYGVLYISLAISVACYVVDIFTCSQLLLFDKWSGQIEPVVPLYISRWVFTGCIILSLVLLVYRWWKAIRAMRTGGITQSYLDPLAVRLQSVRMGKRGRGWRRFLLFAELTKSKKGVEYVALFTYFSFEAWMRIVFAEGPRQAINAMTLAALMKSDVVPIGNHAASKGNSPAAQFFINLQSIAQHDNLRAAVLFGMLFTVIIWIFTFLSLIIACILWVVFLWHHIPSQDGGLRKFCKRKVESKLQSIVDAKIMKALAKEDMKRAKEAAKGGDFKPHLKRQPTLPQLDDTLDDKSTEMPSLSRQTTVSTLPEYSGPSTNHEPMPTLPNIAPFSARPPPTRSATQSSKMSYASATTMQSGRSYATAPLPSYTPVTPTGQPMMNQSLTGSSAHSQPMSRPGTAVSFRKPVRQNTGSSASSGFTPGPYPPPSRGLSSVSSGPPPATKQQNTQTSMRSNPSGYSGYSAAGPTRQPSLPHADTGYFGPQSHSYISPTGPAPPYHPAATHPPPPSASASRFVAYNPQRASQAPSTVRNFSEPASRGSSVYSAAPSGHQLPPPPVRYGTAPPGGHGGRAGSTYDATIFDAYAQDRDSWRPEPPRRAHTAGPGAWF